MKKTPWILGILVLLIGLVLLVWFRLGEPGEGLSGRSLAPAESLVYLELTDLPRTKERWSETALARIWAEEEVAGFLEKPLQQLDEATEGGALSRMDWSELLSSWVALVSLDEEVPSIVGAVEVRSDAPQLEALLLEGREALLQSYPTGTWSSEPYHGVVVEHFEAPEFDLFLAQTNGWHILGTGSDLVYSVLDRLSGRNGSQPALAGETDFQRVLAELPDDSDTLTFVRLGPLTERAILVADLLDTSPTEEQESWLRNLEAIGAVTRLEGTRIRDTIYLLNKEPREPEALLSRRTFQFVSDETLVFYTSVFELPEITIPELDPTLFDFSGLLGDTLTGLETLGFDIQEVRGLLGPEMAWQLVWSSTALQPSPVAHFAIRDEARMDDFLERLRESMGGGETAWSVAEHNGLDYRVLSGSANPMMPHTAMVLHDGYFTIGLGLPAVRQVVRNFQSGGQEIPANFEKAMGRVDDPNFALGYAHTEVLFERIYGLVRPSLVFAGAFLPGASDLMDFRKLPRTESVARHLEPVGFAQHVDANGIRLDSTGSITFMQGASILTGGIGATGWALISGEAMLGPELDPGSGAVPGTAPGPFPSPHHGR